MTSFSPQQTSEVLSPSLVGCPPMPLASAQWSCVGTAYATHDYESPKNNIQKLNDRP